jgi:type II restriction enzyme
LVDYVFGIEVGLDTNTRKNRGGKNMEKKVARIFKNNSIDFQEQVKHTDFPELLSLGIDVKQFDYAIQTKKKTYLIETNYYNTGGSKLNETSRAYTDIAAKINQYSNFEFVWITDGKGWLTAKSKLEEAYNNIAKVYNLTSINEFINLIKAEIE